MKKKYKINKSALKRIKIKKNCIQRKHSHKSHLLLNKQTKSLRALKINSQISKADIILIKSLI
jgi:ribosomal protein L35